MRIGRIGYTVLTAAVCLLYSCGVYAGDKGFREEAYFCAADRLLSGTDGRNDTGSSPSSSLRSSRCQEPSAVPFTGEFEPGIEEVHITVPGMSEKRTLLWISDLHLNSGAQDPDVAAEYQEDAASRYEMMKDAAGLYAEEIWPYMSGNIDSFGAEYVILGADMLDYVTAGNLDKLKEGLEEIQTPWMYLRADHDYGRWYTKMGKKKMRELHRIVAPQNKLWIARFPEFTVAGLDNTTSAVSGETLEEFRQLCEEGLPIILCTHVPFDSGRNDSSSLAQLSRDLWGGRVLCWGDGDEYDTSGGGCMKELLDLITAPDSPVCAVLAGHLHSSWDGALTDTCIEHVFSAAFEDWVGLITVSGEPG